MSKVMSLLGRVDDYGKGVMSVPQAGLIQSKSGVESSGTRDAGKRLALDTLDTCHELCLLSFCSISSILYCDRWIN